MKTPNICYCRDHKSSKIMPGYCSTCLGPLPDTQNPKITPSTLEDLISLKSEFLESAYMKTLPQNNTSKSSSSPTFPEQPSHKRSYTTSKLIKFRDKVLEKGPEINKIHNLNTESNVKTYSTPFITTETLKSPEFLNPKVFEISLQSANSGNNKHHGRASSSIIENSIYETKPWEKSQPAFSNHSDRLKSKVFPSETSKFRFAGHLNSVNCLSYAQNRLFSAGSDYQILAWPRIDPLYVAHNKTVSPSGSFKALSRPVRALCTSSKRLVVSAGDSESIKLWKFSINFECVQVLKSPDPCTKCLLASETQVLSAGSSGLVHVWDLEASKVVNSHKASNKRINALIEFSNNLIVTGSCDGLATIIDLRCVRNVQSFLHPDAVNALICNEGKSFYSAADKFRVWFR